MFINNIGRGGGTLLILVIELIVIVGLLTTEIILHYLKKQHPSSVSRYYFYDLGENIRRIERFSQLIKITDYIEINTAAQLVGMTRREFLSYIRKNKYFFPKFKISRGNVNFTSSDNLDKYVRDLRNQFDSWISSNKKVS